ncbi:hypothetical protein ACIQCR_17150 [Streptomyces sp. NPDC093249]|uniref:hypothetical protein n=1 Tax=unclassified Streptomyces TaxID=2593676 RepID=UPI00344B641D
MSPAEGEWRLWYSPYRDLAGADITFGSVRSGCYLTAPYEIAPGEVDAGDIALPRQDGVRFGRDRRGASRIVFELAVDASASSTTQLGRHANGLSKLSALSQAWDAEALRLQYGHSAVLSTTQGGRSRRFYGRPRKWAPVGSRLTRMGYTPVVADFQTVDDAAYDDVEQIERVPLRWVQPPRGVGGPIKGPIWSAGDRNPGYWRPPGPGGKPEPPPGDIISKGTKPTWPVITVYGQITNPVIRLQNRWTLTFDLSLKAGEKLTVDTRPWIATVTRGSASVAGLMRRGSPRLDQMRMPPGRCVWDLDGKGAPNSYMTISWRDAFSYM